MAKEPTVTQVDPKMKPEVPLDKPPEEPMQVFSQRVVGNELVEDFGNGITVRTKLPNKKSTRAS